MGRKLKGLVHATIVRGCHVFQDGENFQQPMGKLIKKNVPSKKMIIKYKEIDAEFDDVIAEEFDDEIEQ